MTLDSLVSSLGSSERNLAAHSLLLLQQQQQAPPAHVPAGHAPPGCGGAQALLQCCYQRLSHSAQQRTRGIIVLSLSHSARAWLQPAAVPAASPLSAAPPRLVLDACRNRFQLGDEGSSDSGSTPAASKPVSLSSQQRTSVQQLSYEEIHNLRSLRAIIEAAAKEMHAQYDASGQQGAEGNAASAEVPVVSVTATNAPRDPYSVADEDDGASSFPCASVTLLIDDLVALVSRFGSAPTLTFLQALKGGAHSMAIIAGVDLDGLACVAPLSVGSGTGNMQPLHSHVGLHAHLMSLATTTVSIRALRMMSSPAAAAAATGAASDPDALLATVNVSHRRVSGRMSHVVEEVEVQPRRGVVRKVSAAAAAAAVVADAEQRQKAAAAGGAPASLAHQFGSSFSLDLTSKARTARAQTVLPYQHTGAEHLHGSGGGGALQSSLDVVEDTDLLSDDDHDADDPDDDLEI